MCFVLISFAMGGQYEPLIQWNLGFNISKFLININFITYIISLCSVRFGGGIKRYDYLETDV